LRDKSGGGGARERRYTGGGYSHCNDDGANICIPERAVSFRPTDLDFTAGHHSPWLAYARQAFCVAIKAELRLFGFAFDCIDRLRRNDCKWDE
jgi:hypothetical protein